MEDVVTGLLDQFERGKISRRGLVQGLTAGLAAAAAGKSPFKAIAVNHISYVAKDYARTRDFYAELFGMKVTGDNGKQAELSFGNTFLLPRNARDASQQTPLVNHIA